MEMPKEWKMEQVGALLANMDKENVKVMPLKPVLSRNMTFTLKPFLSLSVLKATLTIGLQVERNVLKLTTWTGMIFTAVPLQLKEFNMLSKWLKKLRPSIHLILMSLGSLLMINILKAQNLLLLPTWSDLYAQFTEAQLKLMPVVDINKLYSFLVINS